MTFLLSTTYYISLICSGSLFAAGARQPVPDVIKGGLLRVIQNQVGPSQSAVELIGLARADDRSADARLLEYPGHGGRGQRPAPLLEEHVEVCNEARGLAFPVSAAIERADVGHHGAESAGRVRLLAGIVLARQHPACEWVVGEDSDALVPAQRQQVLLDVPVHEVVAELSRCQSWQAKLVG